MKPLSDPEASQTTIFESVTSAAHFLIQDGFSPGDRV